MAMTMAMIMAMIMAGTMVGITAGIMVGIMATPSKHQYEMRGKDSKREADVMKFLAFVFR